MKTKKFKKYLEKRLNKEEIADVEAQARAEIRVLRSLLKSSKAKSDRLE